MGRMAVTKAVILAGGRGSGLCPLANYYPKTAFPVGGEPLLAHLLAFLERSGVTDVAILTAKDSAWDTSDIQESARTGSLRLSVFDDDGSRGTAGSLRQADRFFGTDHFFLIQPNLYIRELDLATIADVHCERGSGVTVVVENRRGFVPDFEYLEMDDRGRVMRFNVPHYSTNGDPSVAFSGIYVFDPRVFESIDREYTDIKEQLLPLLYERDVAVDMYRTDGKIHKIYTLDDYFQVHREVLFQGPPGTGAFLKPKTKLMDRVWVGENVKIASSANLIGPIILGDNCTIEADAQIIGPTTVGQNSLIGRGAHVRESVMWSHTQLAERARVEFSLLADHCAVPRNESVDHALIINNERVGGNYNFLATTALRPVLVAHGGAGTSNLTQTTGRRKAVFQATKRAFDLVAATAALLLTVPLYLPIGVGIKLTSKGPVFYRQTRCGQNGRPFKIFKFRTMVEGAEKIQSQMAKQNRSDGPMFKVERDRRVTKVGVFLRKTSLDELPQLLNVLLGHMSLVGPRPLAMHEMTLAPSWRDIRLSVRPGVTGLWQVNSRSSPYFADWLRWDVEYVVNQSLWLDLKVLAKTAKVLIIGSGAM